jgi:hypothetical protein
VRNKAAIFDKCVKSNITQNRQDTEALEHGNDAHCYSEVINDLFLQLHVMYHGVGPRRGAARVPIPRFFVAVKHALKQ